MGNFDMLPSDIMLDILSRLPTESALDCKLVSKSWKNLISQMKFNLHLDSSGKLSLLLYEPDFHLDTYGSDTYFSGDDSDDEEEHFRYTYAEYDENLNCFSRSTRMNLRPPFNHSHVLGSCNGLICFNAFNFGSPLYEYAYICNPVTREYVVLPKFEGEDLLTGFGYVPSTNEYKVVRIDNSRSDPNFGNVQIYTLGSGIGWRNVKKKMDYNVNRYCLGGESSVFANGAIHWVDDREIIVAFSLADEEFRELPSPPCLRRNGSPEPLYLHVLDDYLCAYVRPYLDFDIWVLKKNQNYHDVCIWSKELSDLSMAEKPITITKNGGLLCRHKGDKKVYCYSPDQASSSRMLVNIDKNFEIGIPHKNTLVSLKALGEEVTKLTDLGERARTSGGTKNSSGGTENSFLLELEKGINQSLNSYKQEFRLWEPDEEELTS